MKIQNKLFLTLFSFSLLLVTALILLIQWSIRNGMIEYVNSKEVEALMPLILALENEYKKEDSWGNMQGKHKRFGNLLLSNLKDSPFLSTAPSKPRRPSQRPPEFDRPPPNDRKYEPGSRAGPRRPPPDRRGRPPKSWHANYALLDSQKSIVAGHPLDEMDYTYTTISVDKTIVGWLAIPKRKQITDGFELDFIEQQQSYLWLIALVAMMLVVLVTMPLARHLAEPIKLIMLGMHKLTQGDYQQKIELKRKDELGELSRDFNELAVTLHENESTRKRWLANISHELRTPVAILRGELEAMLDGVRPFDKSNVGSANDEVKHLQRLIDDLHQLTSADIGGMHYRKKNDDLALWLQSEVGKYTSYLAAEDIKLVVEIEDAQAPAFVDETRLCQLFDNVMNNCIKYAEASLVKLSLEVDNSSSEQVISIKVEDNGVGVAEQHLPNLFEHLYRVESSRNRKTGGAGLGLSICAHIVAAHQGKISAQKSHLGGLAIIIELPLIK